MTYPAQASFETSLASCSPVIAIIRGTSGGVDELLDWLVDSRVNLVEVTTNTTQWQKVVAAARERPFTHVGVGTVLSRTHVADAAAAGATFTVAPGLDSDVVAACESSDIAHLPGVMTPSEIQQAQGMGLSVLKLFPAGSLGIGHLRSLRAPFDDVSFIPTGGISVYSASEWLDAGAIAVGIGGALTAGDSASREDMHAALKALAERSAHA
jgi:2-dehydro-3-deoxyphosphogluconate aldolase/(4S)-4-hydroxy-2-oxoglutarate aldolase